MTDLLFVAIAVAFFALCVGYVRACDRIVESDGKQADDATPDLDREFEASER
ncbi:MAG: hypothetical protein ACRDPQ_19985 [Nocardioidaceae bacterium]